MKKNGFTLIEVLAVIIILGIITAIATPIVLGVIDRSKQNMYDHQMEIFKEAATMFVSDNINTEPGLKIVGTPYILYLSDMIEDGYIESPVKNPLTGVNFSLVGCSEYFVEITREVNAIYTYNVMPGNC